MTYIECPECGQKALSVATRCPRCGHNYPDHFRWRTVSKPVSKLRPVLLVGGALLGLVVVAAVLKRLAVSRTDTLPSVAVPIDTAPPIPAQPRHETMPAAADSSKPVTPAPSEVKTPVAEQPAVPPASPAQSPRYARMWVNVRRGRSPSAAVARVLNPGEAVLVDSLRLGWYRVLVNGRALGYVYRALLDTVPPRPRR